MRNTVISREFNYTPPERCTDVSAVAATFRWQDFLYPRNWIFASMLLNMQKEGFLQKSGRYILVVAVRNGKRVGTINRVGPEML